MNEMILQLIFKFLNNDEGLYLHFEGRRDPEARMFISWWCSYLIQAIADTANDSLRLISKTG